MANSFIASLTLRLGWMDVVWSWTPILSCNSSVSLAGSSPSTLMEPLSGVIAHTVMDYASNWEFYFGRPVTNDSMKEIPHSPISDLSQAEQHEVEIVFIAGAYMSNDFNKVEANIRLAESYSIELWNRGYKVFCPHLNTCHFEVKAKAREETYKEFDMTMLKSCDAVLVLPNWETSAGAKEEIDEANRLGIPVFYSLDELPARS